MKHLTNVVMALFLSLFICLAEAADSTYLLGTGDVLNITVYSHENLTLETRVAENGMINFPLLGEVLVGGLTTLQAEKKIASLLETGSFIVSPQVNIIVSEYMSKLISVLGSVQKPGRYPLDRNTSLADILALAGGLSPDGSQTIALKMIRDGKQKQVNVDIDTLFNKLEAESSNIQLQDGDTVYVPRAPMFYIYGEVQKPGSYRVERNMTIQQALAQGGGPTMRGTQRSIKVYRRDASDKVNKMSVELLDKVEQDDVIYIEESLF